MEKQLQGLPSWADEVCYSDTTKLVISGQSTCSTRAISDMGYVLTCSSHTKESWPNDPDLAIQRREHEPFSWPWATQSFWMQTHGKRARWSRFE